jgi:hypothetical protein
VGAELLDLETIVRGPPTPLGKRCLSGVRLLSEQALRAWLVESGLNVERDGQLLPTERARELADCLRPL